MAICGANTDGSSRDPAFRITAGKPGERVMMWLPHSAQNSRVTGLGMSLRLKLFGSPFV